MRGQDEVPRRWIREKIRETFHRSQDCRWNRFTPPTHSGRGPRRRGATYRKSRRASAPAFTASITPGVEFISRRAVSSSRSRACLVCGSSREALERADAGRWAASSAGSIAKRGRGLLVGIHEAVQAHDDPSPRFPGPSGVVGRLLDGRVWNPDSIARTAPPSHRSPRSVPAPHARSDRSAPRSRRPLRPGHGARHVAFVGDDLLRPEVRPGRLLARHRERFVEGISCERLAPASTAATPGSDPRDVVWGCCAVKVDPAVCAWKSGA